MKESRISLRVGTEETELLQKARVKLARDGKKQTITKTVKAGLEKIAAMPDEKPEVFYCDRDNIRHIDSNIEIGLKNLQAFLDEFHAVADKTVTLDEIEPLIGIGRSNFGVVKFEALRDLVVSKLCAVQQSKFSGLCINADNVRVPNLEKLFDAAEKLFDVPMVAFRDVFYWQCYSINDDNKVNVIPEAIEVIKNCFRAMAVTENEKRKLKLVKELVEVLNRFLDEKPLSPEKLNIAGVVFYDSEVGRFYPAETFIKYGLR